MKILVTGGAGFIGSHIVKQLLQAGDQVVVYDLEVSKEGKVSNVSKEDTEKAFDTSDTFSSSLTFIKGDVRDQELVVKSLAGVDAVIHMAAFISVEESVKNPVKYIENNVLGTASLLEAMREAGVKKIVFSSSATVYGQPKSLPITEDFPLSAANPYAATKISSESICEAFAKTDGFEVMVLRYFNPYGPGEFHDPETHAIPNFIRAGLSQGRGIKGTTGSTSTTGITGGDAIPLYWKGEQVRDFIYVEDLAAAHVAVLSHQPEKGSFEVFNVGSDNGVKIIDVVNELSDIFGYELEVEDLGERVGDVMANYASSDKLKKETGWEAKVGLKEGLKRTVEWFRDKGIEKA